MPPSNLYAADDGAREAAEQLSRDAGYAPVYIGGLDKARILEDFLFEVYGSVGKSMGRFFYRFAKPGEL